MWGTEEVRAQLEWSPGAWWREPWRLVTYGCVHANAAHLALNALVALAVSIVLLLSLILLIALVQETNFASIKTYIGLT